MVPAALMLVAMVEGQNDQGGRGNGGHDAEGGGGRFNQTGIHSKIPTSCFELQQGSKQVAP